MSWLAAAELVLSMVLPVKILMKIELDYWKIVIRVLKC